MEISKTKGTIEKALQINLDRDIYGTLAEIGAGQEVARNFFIAGAAAGTIAKTMSAYDMQFSDSIYGKEEDQRYVSQSRVRKMLNHEYQLLIERLKSNRPDNTLYFAFADTVAAKGFKSARDCHGWMGIQFQSQPCEGPNEIVLHLRMKDNTNIQQQECLGILGINLIYAAFYYNNDPELIIESLLDNLSTDRIEIDMIKFDGPCFRETDNRYMSLHLVRSGLTHSVFFTKKGEPIQGTDLLYKKNILVLRGSFRPFTNTHHDLVNRATQSFKTLNNFPDSEIVVLTELSMSHLLAFGNLDKSDFIGRVDTLCTMGYNVQISDFAQFYELKEHLIQYTKQNISLALGIKNIAEIFSNEAYTNLTGGIIEGLGKLFSGTTNLFVYPKLLKNGKVRVLPEMTFPDDMKHLFQYFLSSGKLVALENDSRVIDIFTKNIRNQMSRGDGDWVNLIPEPVYHIIKKQKLFGYP